jgi:hypothetical protein
LGSLLSGGAPITLSGQIIVPKPTELTLPFPQAPLLKFPWQLPQPPPGVHLRADLGIDSRLGNALRFHDAGLRIYCPPTKSWADANPTYSPVLAAAAKLDVPSAGLSLDIAASGPLSSDSLMLFGIFEGVTLGKLAQRGFSRFRQKQRHAASHLLPGPDECRQARSEMVPDRHDQNAPLRTDQNRERRPRDLEPATLLRAANDLDRRAAVRSRNIPQHWPEDTYLRRDGESFCQTESGHFR